MRRWWRRNCGDISSVLAIEEWKIQLHRASRKSYQALARSAAIGDRAGSRFITSDCRTSAVHLAREFQDTREEPIAHAIESRTKRHASFASVPDVSGLRRSCGERVSMTATSRRWTACRSAAAAAAMEGGNC